MACRIAWLLLPIGLLLVQSQGALSYNFIGCFLDSGNRDLPLLAGTGSMSSSRCNQLCTARRYRFFGLQAGNECWCGNSYGKHGRKPNSQCSITCSGRSSQKCGAGWRNSIYASDYKPSSTARSGSSIRDRMAAKIQSMRVSIPHGVVCSGCLISAMRRLKIGYSNENFPVSELSSRISRYPAKARAKLGALKFGANVKTTFEDSTIKIGPNHATKGTYFGMAERAGNSVHLGVVSTEISANLVQKYRIFHRRVCRRIIFWKRCRNHTIRERRGYHGNEIRSIDTALQSETMKVFAENLHQIYV